MPLPGWFRSLDARQEVAARCPSDVLGSVREEDWAHHIPRLMVLGNWAMQHGYDPQETTAWYHESFVDGYDWVMVPNVVGMALHADGGVMATKPYAGGGAHINRMSDYCGGCRYDPKVRVREDACPYTAGYWAFVHRKRGPAVGQRADPAGGDRDEPARRPGGAAGAGGGPGRRPAVTGTWATAPVALGADLGCPADGDPAPTQPCSSVAPRA